MKKASWLPSALETSYTQVSGWYFGRSVRGLKVMPYSSVAAAMVLPMHSLEPFLLMLSSVFVPLFGVVISQLSGGRQPAERRIHVAAAALWIAGIAVFHLSPKVFPDFGSAIPALVVTLGVGALLLSNDTFLRTAVDEAIAALSADGTIAAILEQHDFPATTPP